MKSRVLIFFLIFLSISIFMGSHALASRYFVDGVAGADTNSGASWPLAFKTIQYAVYKSETGDEIWVKAGNISSLPR